MYIYQMHFCSLYGIYKKKTYVYQFVHDLDHIEPLFVKQALSNTNWTCVMEKELTSLSRKNTWTLIPVSLTMNIVGNMWIFKLKKKI